ncbi:MAG: hypothetical protein IK130_06190, partial [Oscillospiraceae bacterium]|nr:hypothetical protein [Oscillospiraceae bacterium]
TEATKRGDANLDGKITVADAVIVARVAAEDNTVKITDQGKVNANVDGQEGISSEDLTMILKAVAGMISL